jgi:hypothetical protein
MKDSDCFSVKRMRNVLRSKGVDTDGILDKRDLTEAFIKSLRVPELRVLLTEKRVPHEHCLEKEELVALVRSLAHL